jgi:fibronectin-binding autotransporter adhesin
VRSAGLVGWLGNFTAGNWTDTIVNDGTILAASAGGILTLGSSFFTNAGGIAIGNGGNVMFAGVGLTNTGGISLNAGSVMMLSLLAYYEAPNAGATVFSNSGTIHMLGGILQELTGNGLFPAVALVNQAGGLIQGLGNVLAPVVNNGVIEGKYGPNLSVTGAISGTGTLQVDQGCVLELGNAVSSSQTVSFTGTTETLRIDDPQGFAAHVANFISGDTLDIAGTPLNTVAVSNGTLVLGTGYGQLKLDTTAPLGGEVSVGADTHGGDLVNYVQQGGGGGQGGGTITTIGVTESKMLFWASPVGDIFTGTAANMQGANIANWTTADSLDFVDYLGNQTRVSYAQANGQGTITVTDGSHTDTIGLLGTYTASWFHVTTDAHGGALVTYSQS